MSVVEKYLTDRKLVSTGNRDTLFGWLLILPAILLITVTIVYPFFSAIRLSFYNVGTTELVGLSHYEWLLTHGAFWSFTTKSVLWTIGNITLQGIVGIGIALLLHRQFFGRDAVRTLMLIPFVVPTAVTAITWRWLFNATYGPLNQWALELGLISTAVDPLGQSSTALATVTLINTWRWAPLVALVVFAVLQTIPREEYEAARIEGAGVASEFYHVTYPHLKTSLTILGLLGVLLTFNIFDMIWLLTQGGPVGSTTTLPVFIYDIAFNAQNIGRGTAVSVVLFLLLVLFVIVYFQQEEFEEGEFA